MTRSNRLRYQRFMAALLCLLSARVFSQSISYQNPASFYTCDEASFSFTVQNPTGAPLNNPVLTVNFTTTNGTACGIGYVPGTVSAPATQGNISNLSAPQFVLPTLAAGASLSFTIQANADCQTAACIDNAEVFVNNLSLAWSGGSTSVTTNPYVVDRALLVITNVASTVLTGTRGDVLQRKITIRNTRPAALSSFQFKDVYQPGISVASAQGTVLPSPAGSFEVQLGAADFAAFGDGDGLFEFNEAVVVTEDITITTCGVDEASSLSTITASWGCEAVVCQQVSVNAVVAFEPYDKIPEIAWEPIFTVPECFCGPEGYQQGMKITNLGEGTALNVQLNIGSTNAYHSGLIDTASVHVDSAGVDIDFVQFNGSPPFLPPTCGGPAGMVQSFSAIIASLAPGESVTVLWDVYLCDMGCNRPDIGYEYTYGYFKECPPNIFVQVTKEITVGMEGIPLASSANISGPVMTDESLNTVFYEVNYDSLSLLEDEQLTVQIYLLCGMEWVPTNSLLLGGQAPVNIDVLTTDTLTTVTAVYDLPLSADSATMQFDFVFDCDEICLPQAACQTEVITSCPGCGEPPFLMYFGEIVTSINKCGSSPLGCNIQSCATFSHPYDCPIDSICLEEPPGYLRYDFTALRKNYGLPDNNNDRFADAPTGLPDLSLVQRQRFMPGDTIQATFRGMVVIDKPGATLPYGLIELGMFGGGMMRPITRDSLLRPDKLSPAGSLVRIYDSSAGVWYDCPNPVFTTSARISYKYDLTQLKGTCLPANFAFDQGDSLIFVSNYRIGHNPVEEFDDDPFLGDIDMYPQVFLFDADTSQYSLIDCNSNCNNEKLLLTYYQYRITPGTFGVPPCGPSTPATPSIFTFKLHEGNFFPFEHRNLLTVEQLRLALAPSAVLDTTRLIFLRLQNGPVIASQVFFTPNLVNGEYLHDLLPYQTPSLDEGFSANFNYVFEIDCTNKFSMPVVHTTRLNFAPGLPELLDPRDYFVPNNGIRPLIANLSVDAPLFNLTSFSNQMLFDFKLKNTPTIAGSLTSGPAPNTWMYITSQSGLVTDFQLIDQSTGQPVPLVNGVWQLGNLPVNPDGFPYRLLATNNSCELENLQLHYGWNCDQLQSTVQSPCYEQVRPLTIISPPGEIDMIVTSPSGCSPLCDTIPYHEIEVFNAQLGSVYDLRVKALLPPGMSVLTGSCEVEYPTGSGITYPIGDPAVVSTGVLEWNLSLLFDSIAAGLPGVSEAPFNSLTLRFLGETTCDFVADAYTLFIAAAEQNCGTPTNSIAKPGDPICIDGVTPPYTANISATPTPGFGCNNDVGFEVSFSASTTLPPGACLIATLPPGIGYQTGSCQNQCNTTFNCTPTVDGSLVTWQLPAGLMPGQLVCFQFNTQGWAGIGCENGVVLFRSAAETQAICALTGDSCSTKVSTGSLIVPYDPQRPAYALSDFSITATNQGANDEVVFSIDVTNNGAASLPPTVVQFFTDNDGDGDGDQLLFTQNYNSVIGEGQTATVTGSFAVPSAMNLCQLLAVIDASQQCACAGDVAQVTAPIVYETGLSWTVCSGASQPIGIAAMPGFDYQWSPDDCLADAQAAMTVFNCTNDGAAPVSYEFTLAEGNGFCEIQNKMTVTVQPEPGIAYADSPICQGESANLAATDGVSFNWQGPGIAQPNQQIVTVTPTSTSNYAVTVTDAFGCTGTDVTTVVVAPLPNLNAGPDESFCPGELAQLNATNDPDWDYLWSPQNVGGVATLNDPTIANPLVLTTQTTTFNLSVLDENGCSATDVVTIGFADSLVLTMPADLTICAGNSTTLAATTNVSATFVWSPNGTCVNPPNCSSLLVSPSSTTVYTANVTSADGCPATGSVTVTVVTDQIVVNGPAVEICEGQSVEINGELVSVAGIYCDTFSVAGNCDSVYCVQLLLKPGIDTVVIDSTICPEGAVEFEGEIFNTAGFYCVNFTAPNGCDSIRCLDLTVFGAASVELVLSADTVSLGDTVLLSIAPGVYESIQWYVNDSLLADCTGFLTCENIPSDTLATYTVVVINEQGCIATSSQQVTVVPGCDPEIAEMPNVFSPNGDSKNDVFDVAGPGSETILHLTVWNRWGQTVHDGPGPWDGQQKGKPAASDVYVYLVTIGCALSVDDLERVMKGDVTLLR